MEEYLESDIYEKVVEMKYKLEEEQEGDGKPEYSGELRLRMPKSLHKDLATIAKREDVSLNYMMVVFLVQAVVRYKCQL